MNIDFAPKIKDEFGSFCLDDLGAWARYAFDLGIEAFNYRHPSNRLIAIVSVPSRAIFAPLLAIGALAADAYSYDGSDALSWVRFLDLADGTIIYFRDGHRWRSGRLGAFDSALAGRRIEDVSRSATHFILENNFESKQISLQKPSDSKGFLKHEKQIARLLTTLGAENVHSWLRAVKPQIVINSTKTIFKDNLGELCFDLPNQKSIKITDFLRITESDDPGSGKLLLKSAHRASTKTTHRLALLDTPFFEKLAPNYASSNVVLLFEHHEYDERIAAMSLKIRELASRESYLDGKLSQPPEGVRAALFISKRY